MVEVKGKIFRSCASHSEGTRYAVPPGVPPRKEIIDGVRVALSVLIFAALDRLAYRHGAFGKTATLPRFSYLTPKLNSR